MDKQIILMDSGRIARTLKRMAIQVWERLGHQKSLNELMLVGLNERGFATAELIAVYLKELADVDIKPHQLKVNNKSAGTAIPNCNDKFVLIVDDVIFSGKTMFSALSSICNKYDPESIEIAALLDRGHRKYPLRTDLVGLTVPTKPGEHIEVMLKDGKLNQAVLFKNV